MQRYKAVLYLSDYLYFTILKQVFPNNHYSGNILIYDNNNDFPEYYQISP